MKLRLALGIGALALLIAGLASWDGFDRPTLNGHILIIGPAALPPLTAGEDDVGAFSLCVPRGGTMFVHVLPFTRVLDARGRLFTTTTSVAALQPGQRIQIWTIGETNVAAPQQLSALKIKITANAVAGEDAGVCELSSSSLRQHGTFLLLWVLFSPRRAKKEPTKNKKSVVCVRPKDL